MQGRDTLRSSSNSNSPCIAHSAKQNVSTEAPRGCSRPELQACADAGLPALGGCLGMPGPSCRHDWVTVKGIPRAAITQWGKPRHALLVRGDA